MKLLLITQSNNNNIALPLSLQGFFNPQITLLITQNCHSNSVLDLDLILCKVCVCHFDQILEMLQHFTNVTYISEI